MASTLKLEEAPPIPLRQRLDAAEAEKRGSPRLLRITCHLSQRAAGGAGRTSDAGGHGVGRRRRGMEQLDQRRSGGAWSRRPAMKWRSGRPVTKPRSGRPATRARAQERRWPATGADEAEGAAVGCGIDADDSSVAVRARGVVLGSMAGASRDQVRRQRKRIRRNKEEVGGSIRTGTDDGEREHVRKKRKEKLEEKREIEKKRGPHLKMKSSNFFLQAFQSKVYS